MRSFLSSTARPFAALLAVLIVAPPAFARTLRCESRNYRYTYCRADTYGSVRLERELSYHSCYYGRGWGYDHRGVWVDRGCRAVFAVDEGHRGRYSGYDYYDDRDRDHHDNKVGAAVAGVALGAAVAAAIVASKNKHQNDDKVDSAPNWLVGRFVGYNEDAKAEVSVQISPSGNVTGYLPGGQQVNGYYHDDRINFAGTDFDVTRQGSGFLLAEHGNPDNVVLYRRDR